ncbi:ribonuclease P protein component [Wenzhouxiangella sp. XN24]|uniref:ribonuclease P protein component n=1 Tax=Wenzhouxiangella sp. XN24 TaxID=2713569 RepID=UPI0013EAF2A4|nr:ribonuclease P protein component [Wenzhouxiangella sp. XN24]
MPSLAFTRAQRLLKPEQFTRVFRTGRRRGDACFTVIATSGPGPSARLGLAVSKKVSKSAVQRNRIKRLVRESFRKHGADYGKLDIVVMARPGAAGCDNAALTNSIDTLLERTARLCDASRSS